MIFNRLTKAAPVLLAAAAFALPVAAQAEEAKTFTRAGVTYTYTSEQSGKATVLAGTADGRAFRLVVNGKNVTGHFGGMPVSFTTADVKSERTLAMR